MFPHYVYFVIVGVATMFGAWEGGLTGIATENKKLERFHHDIEAGKYLILIYARKDRARRSGTLMRERHPEAELVAVNRHSSIRSRQRRTCGHERLHGTTAGRAAEPHCRKGLHPMAMAVVLVSAGRRLRRSSIC